jgi:hypothetical protein
MYKKKQLLYFAVVYRGFYFFKTTTCESHDENLSLLNNYERDMLCWYREIKISTNERTAF